MFKVDELVLITGADIDVGNPLGKIKQPSIEEIALIGGEEQLFQSLNIFFIQPELFEEFIDSKTEMSLEEKANTKDSITSFDSLMFIMQIYLEQDLEAELQEVLHLLSTVFNLIITSHKITYDRDKQILVLVSKEESDSIVVDRDLFLKLKDIVNQIFLLDIFFNKQEENKMSEAAKKIAAKMAKAEEQIQKKEEKGSQFSLIISILGLSHPISYLRSLTLYQLYNQFERFNLHGEYDQSMKAALAGASDVEIINWYKKI